MSLPDRQAAQRPQVELQLPAPATERLQPELLYARVRRSTLVVGHFYECKECQQWHFTAATGFAVSKDGVVASCWHLLTDDEEMPKAALVVADYDGHVWPVQEVLAASAVADVCLLRIQATDLEPLPVRAAARTGEHVWCLSNPDHQFGFFSEGMVARKYTSHGPAPGTEPKAGEAAKAGRTPTGRTPRSPMASAGKTRWRRSIFIVSSVFLLQAQSL